MNNEIVPAEGVQQQPVDKNQEKGNREIVEKANNGRHDGNKNKNNFRGINEQHDKTWEGDEPKVGGVLGLRSEWYDKKVTFEAFSEKMTDYVLRELKNARDVVSIVRDMKDPKENFKTKNLPKNLTATEKKSDVEVAIQEQRIKIYATREAELKSNVDKIYGLVKGQCSSSLKTVIKQDAEYEEENGEQNVLWLLEKLKEVTSGLDTKSNKRSNLH